MSGPLVLTVLVNGVPVQAELAAEAIEVLRVALERPVAPLPRPSPYMTAAEAGAYLDPPTRLGGAGGSTSSSAMAASPATGMVAVSWFPGPPSSAWRPGLGWRSCCHERRADGYQVLAVARAHPDPRDLPPRRSLRLPLPGARRANAPGQRPHACRGPPAPL